MNRADKNKSKKDFYFFMEEVIHEAAKLKFRTAQIKQVYLVEQEALKVGDTVELIIAQGKQDIEIKTQAAFVSKVWVDDFGKIHYRFNYARLDGSEGSRTINPDKVLDIIGVKHD